MVLPVLSYLQANELLKARNRGIQKVVVTIDLGRTSDELLLTAVGVTLPDGQQVVWEDVERISRNETACYAIENGKPEKIQLFSEELNRLYSLMPTTGAPTMLISGIPMHRIKGIDPMQDTLNKIKALYPINGRVLDTATGLGYTAIEAAKHAYQVITIEFDPAVLEICRANPWSLALFNNPKIEQRIGDAFDEVEKMDDEQFSIIIHDPPTFSLAGHLYSTDFYLELYRVLRPHGRLFHYIGNPKSKSGGSLTKGVVQRLRDAEFSRIKLNARAFGVVATKLL